MRKIFSAILIISIVFCFTSCSKSQNGTNSQPESSQSPTNKVSLQNSENTSDVYDKYLYKDIYPADLTDKQAQEILAQLVPKQIELFYVFQLDESKIDETQTFPFDKNYVLCTDERFSCVQDIKDFCLDIMTEDAAQKYIFNGYFSGRYDPEKYEVDAYIDYNGKLYRSTYTVGKGGPGEYLTETSRIVERTENSVKVEMNTIILSKYTDMVYTPTLVRTENGWRVDNNLDAGYYLPS